MAQFVRFDSTLWSRIRLVQERDPQATAKFVERYRPPVLAFIRNVGVPESDAEDLAQEVFMRLLSNDVLAKAEEGRGRLRSFLLAVTKNVILDERRKRAALKRGGVSGGAVLDLAQAPEPEADYPSEEEFDRSWVIHLLRSALDTLRQERPLQHEALVAHVLLGKKYSQIAQEMGKSIQDIKNYIHRVRQRLTDLLREEIARYSSSAEEYEEEIQYLGRFLD